MEIIAYVSCIVACFELMLGLIKYYNESKRKKYSDTIKKWNQMINSVYSLRNTYYNLFSASSNELFDYKIIKKDPTNNFKKDIMQVLTEFEGFAEGMNQDIFDYKLYISLTPKEIIEMYCQLQKYIIEERKNLDYSLLFDKTSKFFRQSEVDFIKKTNSNPISKKFKG